tara:strand:+ start:855 stop:1262 length:408 start_codon:yes stop_codon:yes gene_type:complete
MYSLDEIFQQATLDSACGNLDTLGDKARLLNGIKIVKDNETQEVVILNTAKGGAYYKEITLAEYEVFKMKGWRYGVYVLSLSNYRRKLEKVEERIKTELNGRKSTKSIKMAKASRQRIMENYHKISTELNFKKDE